MRSWIQREAQHWVYLHVQLMIQCLRTVWFIYCESICSDMLKTQDHKLPTCKTTAQRWKSSCTKLHNTCSEYASDKQMSQCWQHLYSSVEERMKINTDVRHLLELKKLQTKKQKTRFTKNLCSTNPFLVLKTTVRVY